MQLEDYFLFLSEDDIRIKGHRISIDNILLYFIEGHAPEEIQALYPDLSLEKIYATITYYLQNRQKTDAYLKRLQKLARKSLSRISEKLLTPTGKNEAN